MGRRIFIGALAASAAMVIATAASAAPAQSPLIGTWRVVSAKSKVVGVEGEVTKPKVGYLVFTPELRNFAVIGDPGRKPAKNDAEALALARSLAVYTGKFDLEPGKYTVHLEFSSTQMELEEPQIRYWSIKGDVLTIDCPVHDSLMYPGVKRSSIITAVRDK